MLRTTLCLAILAITTFLSTAHANEHEATASDFMYVYAQNLGTLRRNLVSVDPSRNSRACTATVDESRAAGVPYAFEISGPVFEGIPKAYRDDLGWHIRMGDSPVICRELARLEPLARARGAIETAQHLAAWVTGVGQGGGSAGTSETLTSTGAACLAAVDTLTAAKIATIKYQPRDRGDYTTIALTEARTTICEPLVKAGATWAADANAAAQAAFERVARPYKAAGITGDRLQLVIGSHDRALYGAGGGELTSPLQLKAAGVMFEVLTARDGSVTLRRYQWKGDRLVQQSEAHYRYRPEASAYR